MRASLGIESKGEVGGMRARAIVWIGMTVLAAMPMTAEGQTSVGVRGGVTRTKISGDAFSDASWGSGFTAGGFARVPLNDIVSIEVGVAYTAKGVENTEGGEDVTLDLDYFEVPLVGVISIGTGGPVTPHLYAGPVFSFKNRCEVAIKGAMPQILGCDDPSFGGELQTSSFDLGCLVGFGLSLDVGARAALNFDGMFNFGFSSVDEIRIGQANRNRAFMVTAGASYAIGG